MHYILIGRNPVKVDNVLDWGWWFELNSRLGTRHIGQLIIEPRKPFKKGGKMLAKVNHQRSQRLLVSTIFLGLDHNHFGGKPILFETMIFGGSKDQYQCRYFTIEEAKEGHQRAIELATKGMLLTK